MKEYTIEELEHMLKEMQEIIPTLTLKDLKALYPVKQSSSDSEMATTSPGPERNSGASSKKPAKGSAAGKGTSSFSKLPKNKNLPTTAKTTIVASSDKEIQDQAISYTNSLYKGELLAFARPFIEGWKNGDIAVLWDNGSEYAIPEKLASLKASQLGTALTKEALATYASILFECKTNFKVYISLFSENAWEEYLRIANAGCVAIRKSKDEATGENFVINTNSFFNPPYSLIPNDKVFHWCPGDTKIYSIPALLALKLMKWENPRVANFTPQYITPDLTGYQTFCGTDIASLLYTIRILNFTGALYLGTTNAINATAKRVLAASSECLEPFSKYDDSKFHDWRKNMVANYYLYLGGCNAKGLTSPETTLRTIFKKLSHEIYNTKAEYILPQFTKIQKKDFNYDTLSRYLTNCFNFLKKCRNDNWVSVRDMYDKLTYRAYESGSLNFIFESYRYSSLSITNIFTKEVVQENDYRSKIDYPFFCGLFMTLAALGIVEVAYKTSDNSDTFFGNVDYFKMTPLSDLVFERVTSYPFPKVEKFTFTLEPTSLIIKDDSPNNVFKNYLTTISRPIGGPRYIIDQTSFCNGISSAEELRQAIKKFKMIVEEELPENWQEFFDELEAKTNAVKSGAPKPYHIFTLDPSFRELLQWLSTDPEIRKISLRVEGCYLLVESDHVEFFEKRLAREGYFL